MTNGAEGYLSGNSLINYPFADGQDTHGLFACFADALVCVRGEGDPMVRNASSDGVTLWFDLVVGRHVERLSIARSSIEFPIASGSREWGSFVITMSSNGIRRMGPTDETIFPVSSESSSTGEAGLSFCPKCVVRIPEGVTSIQVYDGVNPKRSGPHFVLYGDVAFKPGNNFRMTQDEDYEDGFALNAIPGAGMGIIPCECEADRGYTGSQLYSEDGHVRLFNDTCYDTIPSTSDGTFLINAKCTACCTCQMYKEIVSERLVTLFNNVKKAKEDLEENLEKYEDAVRKFNLRMQRPGKEDIIVTLSCAPQSKNLGSRLSEDGGVLGFMNRAIYTAAVRNNSFFDMDIYVQDIQSDCEIYEAVASWTDPDKENRSSVIDLQGENKFTVAPGYSLMVTYVGVAEEKVHEADTDRGYSGSITVKAMYFDKVSQSYKELGTYTKEVSV